MVIEAFMVGVYITNRGHKLNTETPMLIFNISGTPDKLLLAFKVICKKLEKDLPPTPRQDSPPETKLRLLMYKPKWRLLEANVQAKDRNIP
jgi:hypothetical protein